MIVRTQSLAGEYVHVDVEDPAIDRQPEDWRHRYDRAIEMSALGELPLKPGQRPVVWRFRHLKADEMAWLQDSSTRGIGPVGTLLDALAVALVGVENVTQEGGQPFKLRRARDPQRGGFLCADRDQLNALLADDEGRAQMGLAVRLAQRVMESFSPRNG